MILVVDNYDSFTYNLVQAFGSLGAELQVRRNDRVTSDDLERGAFDGLVISPGPGRPEDAGACIELIRAAGGRLPVLGVCLGHQALGAAWGGTVTHGPEVVHGKTTPVQHDGGGLFSGLPRPFQAARYHSLVVDAATLPDALEITATGPGALIMGMRHRSLPQYGVQFHPESIATPDGPALLRNFLDIVESRARRRRGASG